MSNPFFKPERPMPTSELAGHLSSLIAEASASLPNIHKIGEYTDSNAIHHADTTLQARAYKQPEVVAMAPDINQRPDASSAVTASLKEYIQAPPKNITATPQAESPVAPTATFPMPSQEQLAAVQEQVPVATNQPITDEQIMQRVREQIAAASRPTAQGLEELFAGAE